METYDILMLIVLGGLTVYGYFKGMAWQIAYLASFVVSYFVAVKFADQIAPVFGDAVPWNKFAAMLAIYVATSFGIWMVFRVVRGGIDRVKLDGFDHQMGAIIGAIRGALWCLGITFIALTVVSNAFPSVRQHIIGTKSGRYIARFIDETEQLFPPEVHQVIGPYLQRLDQELDPNYQPTGGGIATGLPLPNFSGGGGQNGGGFGGLPAWPQQGGQQGGQQGFGQRQATPRQTSPHQTQRQPVQQSPRWPQQPRAQPQQGAPAYPAGWAPPPANTNWRQ